MAQRTISWTLVLAAGSAFAQGPLSANDQQAALRAITEYALDYTQRLPNITTTVSIRREMIPTEAPRLPTKTDLIEAQLSVVNHEEIHSITKINGRAVNNVERAQLAGVLSRGEFGNWIGALFNPENKAEFRWERMDTRNGRRVYVFSFRVPQPGGYDIVEPKRTFRVAYQGLLYADYDTKAITRIQMSCTNIPSRSNYKVVDLAVDYKPTQVAGQEFTLPSHYKLYVRTGDGQTTNEADYKAYRRFASEATITFEADPAPNQGR